MNPCTTRSLQGFYYTASESFSDRHMTSDLLLVGSSSNWLRNNTPGHPYTSVSCLTSPGTIVSTEFLQKRWYITVPEFPRVFFNI